MRAARLKNSSRTGKLGKSVGTIPHFQRPYDIANGDFDLAQFATYFVPELVQGLSELADLARQPLIEISYRPHNHLRILMHLTIVRQACRHAFEPNNSPLARSRQISSHASQRAGVL